MSNFHDLFALGQGNDNGTGVGFGHGPSASRLDTSGVNIDTYWGQPYRKTAAPHSYFDYYFSGQDARIYVQGTEDIPEFATLPIIQFGYRVEQQKMPIYGMWSYSFDAVARGQRSIAGVMTLATKSSDYMKRLLTQAAQTRVSAEGSYNYGRSLTEDDANITKYWSRNIDPALNATGKHIFSVHPPFNFVIIYGIQNMSLDQLSNEQSTLWDEYQNENALKYDTNERLVESDNSNQGNRVLIEAVELQSLERQYGSDGAILAETYQFFARDVLEPTAAQTEFQKVATVGEITSALGVGFGK